MENVKIKDALKIAMHISHLCNTYVQENQPWALVKEGNTKRCHQVLNTGLNALRFLCAILEPFMPSFSAKVYEQMGLERKEQDETLFEQIKGRPGHIM